MTYSTARGPPIRRSARRAPQPRRPTPFPRRRGWRSWRRRRQRPAGRRSNRRGACGRGAAANHARDRGDFQPRHRPTPANRGGRRRRELSPPGCGPRPRAAPGRFRPRATRTPALSRAPRRRRGGRRGLRRCPVWWGPPRRCGYEPGPGSAARHPPPRPRASLKGRRGRCRPPPRAPASRRLENAPGRSLKTRDRFLLRS